MNNLSIEEINKISIQQYKSDIGFRTLVEGVNENLYVIPKYQRKYRWSREQAQDLVESLILGLPIPPIYTCRNAENQLEILDGQQRVMSLFFYYIGKFLKKGQANSVDFSEIDITDGRTMEELLTEKNMLEDFHIQLTEESTVDLNVDYACLPKELRRRIDYTTITVVEIKIEDFKRKSELLRKIFANLNRGGSLLSDQEQRNGIYICDFYTKLREFNRNDECWRKCWGAEDSKEKDLEVLLRLCAMRRYVEVKPKSDGYDFVVKGYHGNYGDLLDHFSEEAMSFSEEEIKEYLDSLTRFLSIYRVSGKQSSKIALMESFYIVSEKKGMFSEITDELCKSVLKSDQYRTNTRQGTVSMNRMNERWKGVYEIWSRSVY